MSEPSKAVFLSYASQDAEAAARICACLRAAGIEVWFDQSELRGGDVWDQSIRKQIKTCALFLPVISHTTHDRREGYFRLEWKLAVDRSHLMDAELAFLLPIVIDDTRDDDERVPERFREVQWTRLPAGETPPAFVERVARLLSPEPSDATGSSPARTPASSTSRPLTAPSAPSKGSRLASLLIAGVVLLGVGYLGLDKFVLSKRSAAKLPAASAQGAIPEKSIAVLPFVDMSEKKDQEYFGDGMAEEILDFLVKIPDLEVIGRTSSFQFKGKTDDLRAIGAALRVAYVVEGSVRRSGERVRITAQLIDTRDGARRWSETYDRDAGDVLKVQDEIALGLVRALQLEITDPERLRANASAHSVEVYDLYLRGLHAMDQRDQAGWENAIVDFRRALELDPKFVPAGERLADSFEKLADYNFVAPQIGFEQARSAADAVLKIAPNSARAHAVLANVYGLYDFNWDGAAREFATARELAPSDPVVLRAGTLERIAVGRWDEALAIADAAISSDPLAAGVFHSRGHAYIRLGRVQEAEGSYRRALAIAPQGAWTHYYLGVALLTEGKTEAALAEMQQEPYVGAKLAGLVVAYQALHRTAEADATLAQLEAQNANDNAMGVAESYAYLGQKDKAFEWLNRAYIQKDSSIWSVKGDPLLAGLYGDPRFKAFPRKMNIPE